MLRQEAATRLPANDLARGCWPQAALCCDSREDQV